MNDRTIVIAGGGASGVLLAERLTSAGVRVTLVEPREQLGRGMAYSTSVDAHVLNVPAGRMSAFVRDPEHFVRYLHEHFPQHYDASSFVPRRIYGDYLHSIAQALPAASFVHERAQALAASIDANAVRVMLDNGRAVEGGILVLATGNADPAPWFGASSDVLAGPHYYSSVWQPGALEPEEPQKAVVLLGTGLTAVDAVLALIDRGQRAPIYMISRRGLLPHEHRLFDAPPDAQPDASSMRDLLGAFTSVSERPKAWRAAIDSLRPHTNRLWQALSVNDQRRFVRHVMPYWNVHRHRMAPSVAARVADAVSSGAVRMIAGRTGRLMLLDGGGIRVPVTLRESNKQIEIEAGRVINCSGPAHDPRVLENPLIGNLLAQGAIRPAPLGIGTDVSAAGALRDRDGRDQSRLFAIGPVRYGTLIETTAMPEIRAQADELALHLLDLVR